MASDFKDLSPDATHLSHKIDEHLKVSYNTPHFTAAIIALHSNYKLGAVTVHITLKRSATTLKVNRCIEWALPYITTASAKKTEKLAVSCRTHHISTICSSDCEICLLEWADLHLTPKKQFHQNHHLKWSISDIASQRSTFKSR